jgi:hypothetical protein
MTISHSDWQSIGYVVLLAVVLSGAWKFRRRWSSGVLDYRYNRVERALDAKRFRFWFIADVAVFAMVILGTADWIARR